MAHMSIRAEQADSMRLDKWLWIARFYRTRALATQAVSGGKVHLNHNRIKPSHRIATGDRLTISKGPYRFDITVQGLSVQRRPAMEARGLYNESDASVSARQALYRQRKLEGPGAQQRAHRPDKRTRRLIRRFRQRSPE
jgi:ribosome-associated heat shock protein Hsp15